MRGKSQTEIDDFFRGLARKGIIPENESVFRFASVIHDDGQCGVFMCLHHLICDAWSISLIAKEIISYYNQSKLLYIMEVFAQCIRWYLSVAVCVSICHNSVLTRFTHTSFSSFY